MNDGIRERTRERFTHAAVMSAIIGPLMVQAAVGVLSRFQNFFCPLNFLPIYAASFILLAPGFYLAGGGGATVAIRLEERAESRWKMLLALSVGGGLFGLLYLQGLSFLIAWAFRDYAPLLSLPGLRMAMFASVAVAANWNHFFGKKDVQALSLR